MQRLLLETRMRSVLFLLMIMSGTIFKRVRRWKIKRLLVNLTKDRLVAKTENGEIRACYEHETEIDYVKQTKYSQELINRLVLPIHYDVKTSFNHPLLCTKFIRHLDEKRSGRFVRFIQIWGDKLLLSSTWTDRCTCPFLRLDWKAREGISLEDCQDEHEHRHSNGGIVVNRRERSGGIRHHHRGHGGEVRLSAEGPNRHVTAGERGNTRLTCFRRRDLDSQGRSRFGRWKIKRLLVNLTKDRLVSRTYNGEIRACYEHETEIDYVKQTKYSQELINRLVLPIHYDVKTSFNHSLLCENFIWYLDYKRSGRFVSTLPSLVILSGTDPVHKPRGLLYEQKTSIEIVSRS
ncbi:hypothetical protein AAHA92_13381 [Salvia divinorum]|uniref:Uncharacterized protein n=1 Tax=Salvia divinorum TaxID=28513 RepID=A0ABD1H828_SALDI